MIARYWRNRRIIIILPCLHSRIAKFYGVMPKKSHLAEESHMSQYRIPQACRKKADKEEDHIWRNYLRHSAIS
jgi:hypothetical protein